MEETYPTYEDTIYEGAPASHYDNYSYGQHAHTSAPRTARYETHAADYDAEYRREYYREPPAYAGKHIPPPKKARHDVSNYDHYYYY